MNTNKWDATLYDNKHKFVTDYGNSVIELLNPQPNEIILDIGCGSGELTAEIAKKSKLTIGIDSSDNMIAQAKQRFPNAKFQQHNAEEKLPFEYQFDAIFSNAALHWMLNKEDVVRNIANNLKTGGRFVFEMGGKGNINEIINSIEFAAKKFNLINLPIYNYFPSVAEYSSILEKYNMKVTYAWLFERPTVLNGIDGLRNWIQMFRTAILDQIRTEQHEEFFMIAEEFAKKTLFKDDKWYADYVRLRMIAVKE